MPPTLTPVPPTPTPVPPTPTRVPPTVTPVPPTSQRDTSFTQSGKYSALLADRHSLVTGWELQANRRTDRHTTFDNGQPELAEFGDNVQAATRRIAAYAQDEWEASAQLAFNAGLRWEGITTSSDSALLSVRNTRL